MHGNTLMSASAGTGKTFWLATHYIRLLLAGAKPSKIVALTFSRAAAMEIYVKITDRLSKAALSDEAAVEESKLLFTSVDGEDADLISALRRTYANGSVAKEAFTSLLRELISEQYLGTIATIDSFILRLVKIFPLELGLHGAVELIDDVQVKRELADICTKLFLEKDPVRNEEFRTALGVMASGSALRTFAGQVDKGVDDWRESYLDNPEARSETGINVPETVAQFVQKYAQFLADDDAALVKRQKIVDALNVIFAEIPEEKTEVRNMVADLCGQVAAIGAQGKASDLPQSMKKLLVAYQGREEAGGAICGSFARKGTKNADLLAKKEFKFEGREADVISCAVELVIGKLICGLVAIQKGAGMVVAQIEKRYSSAVREMGRLAFSDLSRYAGGMERGADRTNVEYRMDAQVDHWELDEFQDTSRPQWKTLENLVSEALQDDERTVSVVGDGKQAIYGWRKGDAKIFDEELPATGNYRCSALDLSFRYGENTADFVNALFGPQGPIGPVIQNLPKCVEFLNNKWYAHWPDHKSSRAGKNDDYVRFVEVTPPAADAPAAEPDDDVGSAVQAIRADLVGVVSRLWDSRRGESIAILVRTNSQGADCAQALRAFCPGIPVVFEGESNVADTPVVQVLLSLLHLAEHPEDSFDRAFVGASPLASGLDAWRRSDPAIASASGAVPADLATAVSRSLSREGLARTLQRLVAACRNVFAGNPFTEKRIDSFLRCASDFEQQMDGSVRYADFAAYLEEQTERDISTPGAVKVLTIHRAKGLGFDHVVVPLLEGRGSFMAPQSGTHLVAPDGTWILPYVSADARSLFPDLQAAYEQQSAQTFLDNLCTYYVALTRAKVGTTIILPPPPKKPNCSFAQVLRELFASPVGAENRVKWANEGLVQAAGGGKDEERVAAPEAFPEGAGGIRLLTPSKAHLFGGEWYGADTLFKATENEGCKHGTAVHEAFEQIEWADTPEAREAIAAQLSDGVAASAEFMRAFERTSDVVALWREKSFERREGKEWTSGQMDRVVFYGKDKAVIYDFKTNSARGYASTEAFRQHLRDTYAEQMAAYRAAVTALTGRTQVESFLLSTAIGEAIRIGP